MSGSLSSLFESVVYKKLVHVDLPRQGSHQHELNASKALRAFFHSHQMEGDIGWLYFSDSRETLRDSGRYRFYDARARRADRTRRSEWRVYCTGAFLQNASVGDTLIMVRLRDGRFFGLVFEEGSGPLRSALDFFDGIAPTSSPRLALPEELDRNRIDAVRQLFIDEMGIAIQTPVAPSDEELVTNAFGFTFPATKAMSSFARARTEIESDDDDEVLLAWINREEELFRALEGIEVSERLRRGFSDVNDCLRYSLSVQNRRESRMGFALQNHLAALFDMRHLRYTAQARTEGKTTADFLFPGETEKLLS